MTIERNPTRSVKIGSIQIGQKHPIAVQSMTATHTSDIDATVEQVQALATEKVKGKNGEEGMPYEVAYPTTVTVAHPGWGSFAYPRLAPQLYIPQAIVNPPVLDPRKPPE